MHVQLDFPALQITEGSPADNGSSRSTPQWRDSDEDSEAVRVNRGDNDREWEQTRESKSEGRERSRSRGRDSLLDLDTLSSLDDDNTGDMRSHTEDKPSSASATGRKRPDPTGQGQAVLPGAKLSQKSAKSDKVKMKLKVKPRGGSAPSLIHSVEGAEFGTGPDKDYRQKYRQKKVAESANDIFVEKAATLGLYA